MFSGIPRRKPIKLGTVQTIDMNTGEVLREERNAMTLLPPPADLCQECGSAHDHSEPHNQQSLYYQQHFRATHGCWPTWTDAMAHCPPEIRAAWREHLVALMREHEMEVPLDLLGSEDQAKGR